MQNGTRRTVDSLGGHPELLFIESQTMMDMAGLAQIAKGGVVNHQGFHQKA
jgi:hypothetical protein